jgi:hypothetical protein
VEEVPEALEMVVVLGPGMVGAEGVEAGDRYLSKKKGGDKR